ncbi:VanZ family protein [Candidatus Pacearchaeota archaeon]|nr:VanZ family protein [Candidatus Pacearchaeota archaeon]
MNNYQKLSLIVVLFTGAFIFYISSLSFPPNPIQQKDIIPVIYHFSIFLLFSFFLFLACKVDMKYFFIVLAISLLYAGIDEFHQYYVPGRNCSISDFGIDFLGVINGMFIAIFLKITKLKNLLSPVFS